MAQSLTQQQSNKPSLWSYAQPFVVGGLIGCFATTTLHPIDLVKVRIQITSEITGKTGHKGNISPLFIAREVYKTSGVLGFYKGLDAALARQVLYTTTRMGIYKTLFDHVSATDGFVSPLKKIGCALTAGFIGSVLGTPADVVLVRMQADPTHPPLERRNYNNVLNAFMRIAREEGVLTLWKGATPTIARGMAVNLGQLAPYDEIRERLNKFTNTVDTTSTRLTAAATCGILASIFSLPFDNMKTKLQKMKPEADGKMPYKGLSDCFVKSIKREGFMRLWVGFLPFYSRTAPHVMIVQLIQDLYYSWLKNKAQRV